MWAIRLRMLLCRLTWKPKRVFVEEPPFGEPPFHRPFCPLFVHQSGSCPLLGKARPFAPLQSALLRECAGGNWQIFLFVAYLSTFGQARAFDQKMPRAARRLPFRKRRPTKSNGFGLICAASKLLPRFIGLQLVLEVLAALKAGCRLAPGVPGTWSSPAYDGCGEWSDPGDCLGKATVLSTHHVRGCSKPNPQ